MSQHVLEEHVQSVPLELAQRFKGVALDFGCSVLKFVYRSADDQNEVATEGTAEYGRLHLVSFQRSHLDEALEYIRERAVITRSGNQLPTVYTTGFGCSQFGKLICEKLNVKLEQLTEYDCFVKSFVYLAKRLPRTELLHSYLEEAIAEPLEFIMSRMRLFQHVNTENLSQMCSELPDSTTFGSAIQESLGRPSPGALTAGQLPLLEAEPDVFPCILSICGSAFFSLRIEKDGSFKIVDGTTRSGKAVFGIGALLTGCETYSELIQLAEKGSPRGVDQYTDELGEISDAADGDSSMYTKHDEVQLAPAVVFSFGKTVGRKLADLKREDLARSWLTYFILDLVQCTHFLATSHGIKRVFFSGGFCDHPLVRNIITTEFVRRSLTRTLLSAPGAVQFDFIKPGAYLGALGCLVSDIEASSSTVTGQSTDE